MKYIQLTQGQQTMVDDDLYDWLNQWKWYYRKRTGARKGGDVVRTLHGMSRSGEGFSHTLYMANLICPVPAGYVVDHIDRNPMNNQRSNLRRATFSINNSNAGVRVNNKLQEKNIHWSRYHKRFIAQIRVGEGKRIWRAFKTLPEAVEFRDGTAQ